MIKSKIVIPCLLTVLVGACAQTSDVMNVGGGNYMISAAASPARGGASGALDLAAKDANKFCAQSGRGEAIIRRARNKDVYQSSVGASWANGTGSLSGGRFAAGRARVTFRCSGNNQSTVVSNASASVDKITLPLKMDWEGVADNMKGMITVPDLTKWRNPEVPVDLKLPSFTCTGSSIARSGNWSKGETARGVFTLKCTNNRILTGTYTSPKAGEGIGRGKDDTGSNIMFLYGSGAS
jgi:hypothetical protein